MPAPARPAPAPAARAATRARAASRWRRVAAGAVAAVVLAGVFASYLRPDFVVALATRAWACF